MNDNFDDYIDRIKTKLNENPELSNKINLYKDELSKIFEIDVDITLIFDDDVESYKSVFDGYEVNDEVEYDINTNNTTMVLSEFTNMLNDEDKNLNLSFDPIYLKKGINNIEDILITTYNDNIIIVPVRKKEV